MATRRRQSARRRTLKRKVNRLRNISVVLLFFLGVALAIILAIPATSITDKIRGFLLGHLGYLSILLPLFLFQTGAWLLDLRMKKAGFRILSGIAVIGYFFTAVIDLVISRLSCGFHDIPGGSIAGGLGDILIPLTGAPITFLILFTAFVASLVAFTGWDIGRDFQSLADSFSGLLGGMKQKRKKSKTTRLKGESVASTSNAWSREQSEEAVTDLPFLKEEITVEPSSDKKPVPVSRKPRTVIRKDQQ
ncbi:MAG: hypothetical protein KAT47_07070, partial [Candidatus Aegiribacteria sp.]|nr:hypothetical protein [Candidatus Aegiribacteria sp.]